MVKYLAIVLTILAMTVSVAKRAQVPLMFQIEAGENVDEEEDPEKDLEE